MTAPLVCVSENLVIGADGKLRLAPWSAPRLVVDQLFKSGGDGKLLETRQQPGKLMIDGAVGWVNDTPVDHQVRIMVTRRHKFWVTSNPNYIQFRDRWTVAVTPKGAAYVEPDEPLVTGLYNGKVGSAGDVGSNSVAEPNPGLFVHWWGSAMVDDWSTAILEPGDQMAMRYREYVWTPDPFSDNANKNSPRHEAESGYTRIGLMVYPQPGKLVTG